MHTSTDASVGIHSADRRRWTLLRSLLRRCARHPVESVGVLVMLAAAAAIVVNAVYLQKGRHPAPLVTVALPEAAPGETTGSLVAIPRPRPPAAPPAGKEAGAVKEAPAPARQRIEPVKAAPLAAPSTAPRPVAALVPNPPPTPAVVASQPRIAAIQRALADFGYGQIKATGVFDDATKSAIEKFERERKLPVTGQISDRIARELATMTGRPLP